MKIETSDEATPRPWALNVDATADMRSAIESTQGEWICAMSYPDVGDDVANAELIVKAVNAYDDLVEALRVANELLTDDEFGTTRMETGDWFLKAHKVQKLVEAALKKAGE